MQPTKRRPPWPADAAGQRTPERERLRVVKTMTPGQPGTVKLLRQYGDALICVRYRRGARGHHRYTTVELLVHARASREPRVRVRIPWNAPESLRAAALARGAQWDAATRTWDHAMQRSRGPEAVDHRRGPVKVPASMTTFTHSSPQPFIPSAAHLWASSG